MKRPWRVVLAATFLLGRGPAAWAEPPLVNIAEEPDKRVELEEEDKGASGTAVVPPAEELSPPTRVAPPAERTSAAVVPIAENQPCPEGSACTCPAVDCGRDMHGGGHFTAGAGLYCLQPYFQTNPAYGSVRNSSVFRESQQQDFHYGMHAEPLAWLGYVSESGLGARVRWWQFNISSNAVVETAFRGPGVSSPPVLGVQDFSSRGSNALAAFASDLHLNVWDIELSHDFTFGHCGCLLAGGVRYAHMAQDYAAGIAYFGFETGAGVPHDILTFAHNFNGAGPTIACEGHRALGQTGLALYGSARGSTLFGSSHQRLFRVSDVVGPPFTQISTASATVLPVGELEVGAEYGHCFGGLHAVAQVAFVGQVWFGAGNASNSDGVFTSGSGNSSNLGLVGLAVRAGVDF
jgi:Legionella pneumophila major outer membrane protein precursor